MTCCISQTLNARPKLVAVATAALLAFTAPALAEEPAQLRMASYTNQCEFGPGYYPEAQIERASFEPARARLARPSPKIGKSQIKKIIAECDCPNADLPAYRREQCIERISKVLGSIHALIAFGLIDPNAAALTTSALKATKRHCEG